jgi:hypothetical protein
MSVDALLKLQKDIAATLSRRANELRAELSKLGGHNTKAGGGSSLRAAKSQSNTVIARATHGPDEACSHDGYVKS